MQSSETLRNERRISASCVTALTIAALGVLCIAMGAVLAAASETPPIATAFWRMVIAAPLCLSLAVVSHGRTTLRSMQMLLSERWAWIAGGAFALMLIFWYTGQRLSSVASTSALINLAPVLIVTIGWLLTGCKPRAMIFLGVTAAFSGAAFLALHSGSLSERALHGDALACAAAVPLALYYATITRLSRTADAWSIMAAVSVVAAPILLVCALCFGSDIAPVSAVGWGKVILLAIFSQVLGQACLAHASRKLGAIGISSVALAEPAVAALLAMALLGAPIAVLQVLGIALVIIGIWFSQDLRPRRAA